jgi:hypothetical protein
VANINYYEPSKIADLIGDLEQYRYQPGALKTVMLNRLSDMLNGAIDIVEPSNPFTYLLETTCVNTAFAVREFGVIAKKLYPRLANTEADLYLHMSDNDYLGRFAEPATASISFNIVYSDFKSNAVNPFLSDGVTRDTSKLCLQIPRMYTVKVSSYVFTLLYPILITEHDNGVIEVTYDTSITSGIQTLTTGVIKHNFITQFNNEAWIRFAAPALEVQVTSTEVVIEKSSLLKHTVALPDGRLFYYAEVYRLVNGTWTPMVVTHTQDVYDIATPTACLTVMQDQGLVLVYIPPVYVMNNLVTGKVRVDIYTTIGVIDTNFSDFKPSSDFSTEYTQVDKVRDLTYLAAPIGLVGKLVYISDRVAGGKGRLSFDDLKASVIDNSIGDRKLPITFNQLGYDVSQKGFTLIKDVDTLTNRIYLMQRPVPVSLTQYPISKLDMDMSDYLTTLDAMLATQVVTSPRAGRYLIPEKTVFVCENSTLRMLSRDEAVALKNMSGTALTTEVNSSIYLSTFYHYVLDTTNSETVLRAYDLKTANVDMINFDTLNSTAEFTITSTGVNLTKSSIGYQLYVSANVSNYNEAFALNQATAYLVYVDSSGNKYYTSVNSSAGSDSSTGKPSQPIYRFDITSAYDIDSSGNIYLTSFKDKNGNSYTIAVPLVSEFRLVYVIKDTRLIGYTATTADLAVDPFVTNFMVPASEVLTLRLGDALTLLNTRVRNVSDVPEYATYQSDVPLTYEHDVYTLNGVIAGVVCVDDACNIAPVLLHPKNSNVLDGSGNQVYKHRKGDIILDSNGDPTPLASQSVARNMTLLFADYRSNLCTSSDYIDYMNYVRSSLTNSIVVKMPTIKDVLLENTEGYMVVPNTINRIKININTEADSYVDPAVSFVVTVYVRPKIFNDYNARRNIDYTIIKDIDTYLNNTTLIKTELVTKLYTDLKEFVVSISIPTFVTTVADYIVVKDAVNKLTLKKNLIILADGSYALTENVAINYVKLD